ncbi:MAG: hypothetical protein HOI95_01080, partial [Chromatiales bacterium]|nr:hypothetical protein [Chromatiales bacterium]
SALALILDDAVEVGERSASGGHDSMLAALATLEGVDEAALQRSYERIAASCSQFGELWCVFTRWDAPRHLLVEAVIRLGVSLRVVVLDDDPASISLGPMKGDPTRLIGIHPGCAAQVLG